MKRLATIVTLMVGCADPLVEPGATDGAPDTPQTDLPPLKAGWPQVVEGCSLQPADPSHLVLTTTDFGTGAVTVVDARSGVLEADVALASTDAIPFGRDGRLALVHRFGHDFIDELQPLTWRSQGQFALEAPDAAAPNPHEIAFDSQGLAYVTLFGSASLLVMDLSAPPPSALVDTVDLSAFADADGRPEASVLVRCADTLWVGVQRLDVPGGFARVDHDLLVAVDIPSRTPYDLEPSTPGAQGLPLRGAWLKQVRRDPTDPTGATLLALTSGIERINLRTGEVSWAVSDAAFADAGISHHQLPLSFAIGPEGRWAYVAAYGPDPTQPVDCAVDLGACFEAARLFEVDLEATPPVMVPIFEGFQALERTLERAGDTLWLGSSAPGAAGLYRFDVSVHPPSLLDGPLPTGLPPYSMTSFAP